ncbi:shikimate kinase [Gracilibacillus kekensis]|uniref:Shikimate kinase n=1 Tax=Gracilibacillus kekensis TaxID=1027249 RepID=A0A1M7P654_9BACI|nr:shikimate kinase [Gracilibacillus kekensis]SHN12120.1 shikimate kinase [Gracilibacillus kekensis]
MKSIYLIGFMGSGKTSIAIRLQEKLNLKLQDTDQMIEANYQMEIPTIFAEKGEETFREYESSVLKQTEQEDTIVATGGGIIEREENRLWLQNKRNVFFLETTWEEISQRLIGDQSRPIWNNQSRDKQQLLEQRLPKYQEVATYIIKTDGKSVEQIADQIISKLDA